MKEIRPSQNFNALLVKRKLGIVCLTIALFTLLSSVKNRILKKLKQNNFLITEISLESDVWCNFSWSLNNFETVAILIRLLFSLLCWLNDCLGKHNKPNFIYRHRTQYRPDWFHSGVWWSTFVLWKLAWFFPTPNDYLSSQCMVISSSLLFATTHVEKRSGRTTNYRKREKQTSSKTYRRKIQSTGKF